ARREVPAADGERAAGAAPEAGLKHVRPGPAGLAPRCAGVVPAGEVRLERASAVSPAAAGARRGAHLRNAARVAGGKVGDGIPGPAGPRPPASVSDQYFAGVRGPR